MLEVLIVDDEYIEGELLRKALLEKCPGIKNVTSFQNPIEALLYLKDHKVQLLFLDVEMPGMNGFEFIDIAGFENMPPVIFTTAYSKYAVKAFKVHALDYLLKPVDDEELMAAVDKAISMNGDRFKEQLSSLTEQPPERFNDRVALTEGQTHHLIRIDDIVRLEGSGSYSAFFLSNGKKITTSKPMSAYAERLQNQGFIKTHQSHLVNLNHVNAYRLSNGGELLLENTETVPVSSRRKEHVRKALGLS